MQYILLVIIVVFVALLVVTALVHLVSRVPYVPTKHHVVDGMLKLANLKDGEHIFDLGSGDGRILFEAERRVRVKAHGFELAPLMFLLSYAKKIFRGSHAKISCKNFFAISFRNADVIFFYLLPHILPRLVEKIKSECKPGTRIVSHSFHIPGLTLVTHKKPDPAKHLPSLYLYLLD